MAGKDEKTASEHETGGDETSLVLYENWPAQVADTMPANISGALR
jgi:hypothetical protein